MGSQRVFIEAHRQSYVSQSGVIAVLESVKKHGLPKHISRQTLKRSRQDEIDCNSPMGELFTTISVEMQNGSFKEFPALNPLALLWLMLSTCSGFREYFSGVMAKHTSNPERMWRICMYGDEVLPGNALKVINERKLMSFYWSFLEFQQDLSNEQLWFHIFSLRTSHLKNIKSRVSQVFKKLCALFFSYPFDLRQGVKFEIPGVSPNMLFGKLGACVADEVALKQIWSCKGSSGTLMCFLCQNVVAHGSGLDLHDPTNTLVPSCVCMRGQCIPNKSELILRKARNLEASFPALNQTKFGELEQTSGLTFSPCGALWCDDFQTYLHGGCIEITGYDWMHVFFVGGVWNTEVGHLMNAIADIVTPDMVSSCLQSISWPTRIKSKGVSCKKAFTQYKSGALSCSASDGLSLYSCIRFLLEQHRASFVARHTDAVNSYLALCRVLDLLVETRCMSVSYDELLRACENHLGHRLVAYGAQTFQPKVHYSLHSADHIKKFGVVVSCFTHERKHRELKRFANQMHNATPGLGWEKGLLEEVVLMSKLHLQEFNMKLEVELTKPHEPSQELLNFVKAHFGIRDNALVELSVSNEALIHRQLIGRQDVVRYRDDTNEHVGEVWFHAEFSVDDEGPFNISVVSTWTRVSKNTYQMQRNPSLIPSSWILTSYPFCMDGGNVQLIP